MHVMSTSLQYFAQSFDIIKAVTDQNQQAATPNCWQNRFQHIRHSGIGSGRCGFQNFRNTTKRISIARRLNLFPNLRIEGHHPDGITLTQQQPRQRCRQHSSVLKLTNMSPRVRHTAADINQ